MEKEKKGQMKTIIALSILLIISVLIVGAVTTPHGTFIFRFNDSLNITFEAVGVSQNLAEKETTIKHIPKIGNLAKIYNEDNLDFDRGYRIKYLNQRNNFSDISFKNVVDKEAVTLTIGARNDNIKGFNISNNNFAIELIDCDSWERYCAFRINGVPTKKLYSFGEFRNNKKNSFNLDENHILKINTINFDFCDNRRFCHLGYEGYHLVDISIERKNGT